MKSFTVHARTTFKVIFRFAVPLTVCLVGNAIAVARQLPTSFDQLPAVVQDHVREIRQSCRNDNPGEIVSEEMQGIRIFHLPGERTAAILIDNRDLCSHAIKGANCHTYGCDMLVFRRAAEGVWTKILDVPVSGPLFLSISVKSEFILAAFSVTGKSSEFCGGTADSPYCDYLLSWKRGHWVWQKLR